MNAWPTSSGWYHNVEKKARRRSLELENEAVDVVARVRQTKKVAKVEEVYTSSRFFR